MAAKKKAGAARAKSTKGPARKTGAKAPAKARQVDLSRDRHEHFKAAAGPEETILGAARYLALEGVGAPEGKAFQEAVGALYGVAYTLKFAMKRNGRDFKVPALEGLWWAPGGRGELLGVPREEWRWKLLIMVPDSAREADVDGVKLALAEKRGEGAHGRVRLELLEHGRCVQALHVGPYGEEPATIAKMREFMVARGLSPRGPHHETYLSNPARTPPARLRAILRQQVERIPSGGRDA